MGTTNGPSPGEHGAAVAAEHGDRGDGIRGRDFSPGPVRQARGGDGLVAAAPAEIRGRSAAPGPTVGNGASESRAQQRLNMRNAALARSLADHAERVAKRSMSNIPRDATTAKERIEALRRRVAQRQTVATVGSSLASDAHSGGAPTEVAPILGGREDGRGARERTSEVLKMHLTHHGGDGLQANSGQGMGGGGGEAARESEVSVPLADSGAQRDAACTAAACQVAWHTIAGDIDNPQRLGE